MYFIAPRSVYIGPQVLLQIPGSHPDRQNQNLWLCSFTKSLKVILTYPEDCDSYLKKNCVCVCCMMLSPHMDSSSSNHPLSLLRSMVPSLGSKKLDGLYAPFPINNSSLEFPSFFPSLNFLLKFHYFQKYPSISEIRWSYPSEAKPHKSDV